jgi:hypothetical protein
MSTGTSTDLSFLFRDKRVEVTIAAGVGERESVLAVNSEPFKTWYRRCEEELDKKRIEIHSVEIQSIDVFGTRCVLLILTL